MRTNVTGASGVVSELKYGDLVSNIIDFAIIAFIIFLVYKWLSRYRIVEDKTKPK